MRSTKLFACVLAAFALGAGAVAHAAAVPKVPAGWMGVVATDTALLGSASAWGQETKVMKSSGVQSVRVPVYWAAMQPFPATAPGEAPSTAYAALDQVVLTAASRGLRVLPAVLTAPTWARQGPDDQGGPPTDPSQYAAFLTLLVQRYGPGGTLWAEHRAVKAVPIRTWQIWNEPNLPAYWSTQPFAPSYVALLKASRTALRAADPKSRIMLAGLPNFSWTYLQSIYAAGGKGLFDVVAVHPYTRRPTDVAEVVKRNRAVMKQHGDGRLPVAITEMGYSSGGAALHAPAGVTWNTTAAGQAKAVRALYLSLAAQRKALNIEGAYWYSWYTPENVKSAHWEDYTGLRRAGAGGKRVSKPALAAYAKVARQLEK